MRKVYLETTIVSYLVAEPSSDIRGQATADSDVDLLVTFAPGAKSYSRFFALSELLEARLGRRVELVTPEALSPFIGPRILAEAQDVLRTA